MAGSLQQALSERLHSPTRYPEDRFEGRGIVVCAGGLRYFVCAWVLISVLRRVYRIDLPIQVWHLGQSEMSDEMRLLLEDMQVEVVDAEAVIARFPARVAGGWPLKPYAILHSRFREVLYLDADTVPLVDLPPIFDWSLYRDQGMLMWPDIVDLNVENPIWRALGLQPRNCASIEAGILVADKQRVWNILDVAVLLNEHVEEIYSAIYGDKDTFLLSTLLLNRNPTLVPHRPFIFDNDLVQRDVDGEPLLQHRTSSKWNLTGVNRPLAVASLGSACEQALAELRERWSGAVFNRPPRTRKAQAEEERLVALRNFHYEPQGSNERGLELLSAGRVGKGAGAFERHWAVVERADELILQFYSTTRLAIELTKGKDGSWDGRGVMPISFRARLIEEAAHQTWPYAGCRVTKSAAECVSWLIDRSLFATGFDKNRALELQAALSLINDCFDDVPEQIHAQTPAMAMSEPWRLALADMSTALASRRNTRLALATRSDYPHVIDPNCYDRVP